MEEHQATAPTSGEPGHSSIFSSAVSPNPASTIQAPPTSAFQSKLSAHNVSRNVGSPKRGKQPAKQFVDPGTKSHTFVNSSLIDDVTRKCDQLDLSTESGDSDSVPKPKPKNASVPKSMTKNARKKQQRKLNALELPPDVPNLNFGINPVIRDYFTNEVGPMYAGSSAQYLDNLAHHPQFQYQRGLQAPHSAPIPQPSSSTPPAPTPFTASIIPTQTFNGPEFSPLNVNKQQFMQKLMNSTQNAQLPNTNGLTQNTQYLKNLMQHPLLCNSVQPLEGQVLVKNARPRNRKRKPKPKQQDSHKFDDYLSLEEVEEGLKNNTLFEGSLRINPKQYIHAYITTTIRGEQDIFIDGLKRRNRSMEGDIVVVELIDDKDSSMEIDMNEDAKAVGNQEKKDEKDQGENKEEESKEDVKCNRRGKVVYIKEKVHPRTCIGNLKLMPDKSHTRALFIPRDSRVPRLNIPYTSWPDNFYKEAKSYEQTLFLAKIMDWDDDRFAMGSIIRNVGVVGNLQTETLALLAENDLDISPFGPEVRRLFPGPEYTIPAEEIAQREDCRRLCIFSIDPYNCRDVDDAVSCRFLENGNYEIGVHISDVSHYLKENTSLDDKVADKATTIYLVERAYHMLPEELCMLCSLFSGVDKLAFSVFWEINEKAEVLSHRFARTVIHSCAQLAYEHAQAILDDTQVEEFPDTYNGYKFEDIHRVVKTLGKISAIFRRNRFEGGALKINQPKLSFHLDPATGIPSSFHINESRESHQLIEEFMLLANMTVAERIHDDHPKLAFLRCHPTPSKFQLEDLAKQLKALDIELDITSAGSLYRSLLPHIGPDCENQQKAIVLSMLCTKPMNRAKYFCSDGWDEDDFSHYALNVPLYTHFTSPIRRYADIMVHRLLSASLQYTSMPTWDVARVRWIAANCNKQKYNAKRAGEMSTELYTLKYIEINSPVCVEAVVVDVKEKYFDVIILAMGFNRRIFLSNNTQASYKYIRSKSSSKLSKLEITWPANDQLAETVLTVQLFSVIQVQMVKGEELVKVETKLVRPS